MIEKAFMDRKTVFEAGEIRNEKSTTLNKAKIVARTLRYRLRFLLYLEKYAFADSLYRYIAAATSCNSLS